MNNALASGSFHVGITLPLQAHFTLEETHELAIKLEHVGLRYRSPGMAGSYWAIRNATFNVHHGETLGVIGRNGSGKSTLLRLLAGIYEQDEGKLDRMGNSASLLAL